MRTAFDQALTNQARHEAARGYAPEQGSPGSPEYWAAWLRFRQARRYEPAAEEETDSPGPTPLTAGTDPDGVA
jgi:hypothetical protein